MSPAGSAPRHLLAAADDTAEPEVTRNRLRRLADAGATLSLPALARTLVPVLANSRFLASFLARHPEELAALQDPDALYAPTGHAELTQSWQTLAPRTDDEAALQRALRRFKYRTFLRITARDVALGAPPAETCAELSLLAEHALAEAVRRARAVVAARHGPAVDVRGAPIPFVVMGMGKLGGRELNYSSDIDLIYFYGTDEGRAGEPTPHQHFARVSELVTRLLGQVTEDGFVFRVDLRLRPEGRGGPLCNSLPSAERYYEAWGRTWERLAWLRARPVAGDGALGEAVLRTLGPWIYRRTLDFGTLDEVHALKTQILRQRQATAAAQGRADLDLKLDPGGIRAVEFYANAQQLIHAGRRPELRDPSTLGALERLYAAGLLHEADRDTLADAYVLFRRIEHRVQMEDERQTHRLPEGPRLDALARRLGFSGAGAGATLRAAVDQARGRVAALFDALLGAAAPEHLDEHRTWATALLSPDADAAERRALLARLDLADPEQAAHLLDVARRRPQSPLSSRASARMRALGVDLLAEVLRSPEPERALTHLTAFMSVVCRRPIYLQALAEHPALARLLVSVFAASDFLSECLLRQPALLDVLYERRTDALRGGQVAELPDLPRDTEGFLETLARYKQQETVRIGLADIAGDLEPEQVEQALTRLAETVLQSVVERATAELSARFGPPLDTAGAPAGGCVLGLGKLGGAELSYGSDLDVVFLYPGDGTDPDAPTRLEWFTRLAQRTISLLGLPTTTGALYRVDTRLRPEGRHGTLVTRLERFVEYHEQRAGPWERLALVRGRPVAGDAAFGRRVADVVARLAYDRPPPADLRAEACRLRTRMEGEVARESPGRYNPKAGRGGLVDIELIAQVLQIEHGGEREDLRSPNTVRALAALRDAGLLPGADRLIADWRFLRRLDHRLRIVRGQPAPELRTDPVTLGRVARRLGYRRDALASDARTPGDRLMEDYRRATERVRARFADLLGSDGRR